VNGGLEETMCPGETAAASVVGNRGRTTKFVGIDNF